MKVKDSARSDIIGCLFFLGVWFVFLAAFLALVLGGFNISFAFVVISVTALIVLLGNALAGPLSYRSGYRYRDRSHVEGDYESSHSSNRKSDENSSYSYYEEHWLPRFEEERQQKDKEREELMSRQDEDS